MNGNNDVESYFVPMNVLFGLKTIFPNSRKVHGQTRIVIDRILAIVS